MSDRPDTDRAAVIGAGSIGTSWAIVFARAGLDVAVYEPDPGRREAAAAEIASRLADLAEFGLVDEPPEAVGARIGITGDLGRAVSGAAWVQESAPEILSLKREVVSELVRLADDRAVVASSTSTMPVSEILTDPQARRRALVAHPGNPPTLLSVVEIVPAPQTEPEAVDAAVAFFERVGMTPVVLGREIEGFAFNRLQGAMMREAYCLVRDGVLEPDDVDKLVREGMGLRWSFIGPFETIDLNIRGGIGVHAERLGEAYLRMGAERGQNDPWTPGLVARVVAARRRRMPLETWNQRRRWRDRMLMSILRAKREALARFGN
jgi:3-hydroxyacyl-CoA dehydrogenase